MELRQLRCFVAVAEELHFGRAAQRLNMSQPPLSQGIRKLEDELGTALFVRTSRSVALTGEGEYLLGEARTILERAREAARAVGRMGRGEQGMLRLGVVGPALEGALPCAVALFRRNHPLVRVTLEQRGTQEQARLIRTGELDLGVMRPHGQEFEGLESMHWHTEPYVAALPQGHALAGKAKLRLADLNGQTLIFYPREYHARLYDSMLTALHRAGAVPELLHAGLLKHASVALVAAGLGLALLPESMSLAPRPGVAYRPLEDGLPLVQYRLAWRRGDDSPLVRRFREVMAAERDACAGSLKTE
ncbi:LysR substrate-binding domain-containing protein [Desulfocurvus sp. DL9XJH121]